MFDFRQTYSPTMAIPKHYLIPDEAYSTYSAYLEASGPDTLKRALALSPKQIIAELKSSGLRGRGGAGFPAGLKWETVVSHSCPVRYAVCNLAEGEPGTFKDRFLVRKNPYAVIEGLVIAAHAVGARTAYIAIKRSFEREIGILTRALDEMSLAFGTLNIEIVAGPEEYLFGEEKALLEVIEGKEPMPRLPEEPPYEIGLFATRESPNPALVNNAETLAHIPSILRFGPETFRMLGTQDTPGTILVTLSGGVAKQGIYEMPAGLTLRQVLERFGGGALPGRRFKAVLPGVSTAIVAERHFDTPVSFDGLKRIGSGLGSAGFIVIDDAVSIPRVAQACARFLYVESCNQCWACKAGMRQSSEALDELLDPMLASRDDVDDAAAGAIRAPQGNRCFLPVQGSTLIQSLLMNFRREFEDRVRFASERVPEWLIPKMTDFDEARRLFHYDRDQVRKLPNWTYGSAPWNVTQERFQSGESRPL